MHATVHTRDPYSLLLSWSLPPDGSLEFRPFLRLLSCP